MNAKPASHRPLALVTGASSGIGLHLSEELAAQGHDLVLVARRESALQSLAERLRRQGATVTVIALDLAADPDTLTARLAALGLHPEVLVNNAGFGLFGKHADTDLADEQQLIDLNITALTRLTKQLLPGMLARGRGRILNVASTAAFQPGPYMAVYYASKAYVLSYSEALAEELRGTGVSVTALCPGPTASGFQDRAAMQQSALVRNKRLPSAQSVARYGVQALMRGRTVAIPGWLNCLMAQSVRFTPRRVVTRLVAFLSRPVGVAA
ncbi:MAG: SDR family oxidoreductase [Burkholderiales bacterium]|uniref:SDR family NAD(P)-dependent oxidoreductase n=1 Tax=Roseateles sp. TaxID=1971397 RepID=UPI000F9CBE7C|nr:MAG: SDR family oxidoreductase [Burkholderiales bacterium]